MSHRIAAARALRFAALSLLTIGAAMLPMLATSAGAEPAVAATYGEGSIRVSQDIDGVPHTGIFHLVTSSDQDEVLVDALAAFAARFPGASIIESSEGGGVSAQAVTKPYQWPDGAANWGYNAAGGPSGLTGALPAFEAAALTWNASGADFTFTGLGATTANTGACSGSGLDGHNTIGWRDQTNNILAVTCSWYVGSTAPKKAVEFDLEFDPDWDWTTGSSMTFDLQSVAIHEMGHALGLGHSPINEAVMYKSYAAGADKRTLHADDIEGATLVYGAAAPAAPPAVEDEAPDANGGGAGADGGGQGASFPAPPVGFSIPPGSSLLTWPYADVSVSALALTGTDTVYGYDALSSKWLHYSPAFSDATNSLSTLQQGVAYWFMTASALEISAAQLGQ